MIQEGAPRDDRRVRISERGMVLKALLKSLNRHLKTPAPSSIDLAILCARKATASTVLRLVLYANCIGSLDESRRGFRWDKTILLQILSSSEVPAMGLNFVELLVEGDFLGSWVINISFQAEGRKLFERKRLNIRVNIGVS